MNHKKLIEKSIKSYCRKWNIDIGHNFLYFKSMAIYEKELTDDSIFNKDTLAFVRGFDCAMEVKK